jgi:hypothetical protein
MEFKVQLPEENYTVIEFVQEDFPGIAVVNTSLRN